MSRIFKGSESTLRLLIAKTSEWKTLENLRIILYTTDIEDAIEVIDGIVIDNDTAIINLAPRAFMDMEEGLINYIIEGVADGDLFHTERQSNYYLRSLSYINEDGIASTTLDITDNGAYRITPNDGLYVDINVNVPDFNGAYDDGYADGKAEGYTEGYTEGKETGLSEGRIEGRTEGYGEGFSVGKSEGLTQGKVEGIAEQKAKLETIEITENGTYVKEDGYNKVDVAVPVPTIEPIATLSLKDGDKGVLLPSDGFDAIEGVNYEVSKGKMKIPNGICFSGSTFTEFDGSNWDWSLVYDYSDMFKECKNLTKVINIPFEGKTAYSMFFACTNLNEIKFTGDASNVDVLNKSNFLANNRLAGTMYYPSQYDYSKIIAALPSLWTAVPY